MILGVLGQAGAGKDTTADYLVSQYGFVKIGLADPLKRICREVFGFSDEQLWGSSNMRNGPDLRYPLGGSSPIKGHLTPRFALQTLGTEWGRRCYENTWVDYGIRMAQKILAEGWRYTPQRGVFKESFFKRFMADRPIGVVFSDIRFSNEVNAIRRLAGGYVVRIRRPGKDGEVGILNHASEWEQKGIPDTHFDHILNNNSTIDALKENIDKMFRLLPLSVETRNALRINSGIRL